MYSMCVRCVGVKMSGWCAMFGPLAIARKYQELHYCIAIHDFGRRDVEDDTWRSTRAHVQIAVSERIARGKLSNLLAYVPSWVGRPEKFDKTNRPEFGHTNGLLPIVHGGTETRSKVHGFHITMLCTDIEISGWKRRKKANLVVVLNGNFRCNIYRRARAFHYFDRVENGIYVIDKWIYVKNFRGEGL